MNRLAVGSGGLVLCCLFVLLISPPVAAQATITRETHQDSQSWAVWQKHYPRFVSSEHVFLTRVEVSAEIPHEPPPEHKTAHPEIYTIHTTRSADIRDRDNPKFMLDVTLVILTDDVPPDIEVTTKFTVRVRGGETQEFEMLLTTPTGDQQGFSDLIPDVDEEADVFDFDPTQQSIRTKLLLGGPKIPGEDEHREKSEIFLQGKISSAEAYRVIFKAIEVSSPDTTVGIESFMKNNPRSSQASERHKPKLTKLVAEASPRTVDGNHIAYSLEVIDTGNPADFPPGPIKANHFTLTPEGEVQGRKIVFPGQ